MDCSECKNFMPKCDRVKDLTRWLSNFVPELPVTYYLKNGKVFLRVDNGNYSSYFSLPKWEEIK